MLCSPGAVENGCGRQGLAPACESRVFRKSGFVTGKACQDLGMLCQNPLVRLR